MTPRRVLIGLLGSMVVFVLLALLAHSVVPEPAHAYWTPPDIAKDSGPSDPGTPYEEPEGGGGDPVDPGKPPEGIPGQHDPVITTPQTPAPPQTDRTALYRQLYAWRFSFLYLIRF